ncbi:hypothetical protein H5410_038934 [Solanum commersonii]|uniref:Uncharacterized protein n=1 Tax=Solanum commersonii TaxID=4109 RepID=A0A9J5YF99_SOLCO|nr:hypothetical protein H5410_038934 [Solanum commersonii]
MESLSCNGHSGCCREHDRRQGSGMSGIELGKEFLKHVLIKVKVMWEHLVQHLFLTDTYLCKQERLTYQHDNPCNSLIEKSEYQTKQLQPWAQ